MSGIPPLLREMDAVVAAVLSPEGRLLEANAGFLRLLAGERAVGAPVGAFFRRPEFDKLAGLAGDAGGPPMPFQVGAGTAVGWTLLGTVTRHGANLLLIAEHDVRSLERLTEEVLRLNEQIAEDQRGLHRLARQLRSSEETLRDLSGKDPLTGLANRRRLDEQLLLELARHRRHADPLSVIAVDIDRFKEVNDTYGHASGDEVIRQVGLALKAGARGCDVVARLGGDEFVVLLPSTPLQAARAVAERLQQALRELVVPPLAAAVSASFGVTSSSADDTPDLLLGRADGALYAAKGGGRDRVEFVPAP